MDAFFFSKLVPYTLSKRTPINQDQSQVSVFKISSEIKEFFLFPLFPLFNMLKLKK